MLSEILTVHGFLTQDLHHIIQKFHNNSVYLGIFLFHGLVALFPEFQFLMLQFLLHLAPHCKLVEKSTVFPDRLFPAFKA